LPIIGPVAYKPSGRAPLRDARCSVLSAFSGDQAMLKSSRSSARDFSLRQTCSAFMAAVLIAALPAGLSRPASAQEKSPHLNPVIAKLSEGKTV
jgi:hypothetical protein